MHPGRVVLLARSAEQRAGQRWYSIPGPETGTEAAEPPSVR
jgi:hypothetical protein